MYEILKALEEDKEVKVVIFKGSGKVFSAGGDVKGFITNSSDSAEHSYFKSARTCDLLASYEKPFIVLADGLSFGGAAVYAQNGRYRVVTERSIFAMPETAIGYFNDASSTYFLPRLESNIGIYLGMTGVRLKGFDLKKVNLASYFLESSNINDLEKRLIDCKTFKEVENTLADFSTDPSSTVTELDALKSKIEKCFGGATVEEIYENLHRDASDWAKSTITTLDKMSPTSLKITHRAMILGRNLTLRECLKMELRIVVHILNKGDTKEGVRALLVDKDNKPKWNPKSLHEVTEERVSSFFEPLTFERELTFGRELKNKL